MPEGEWRQANGYVRDIPPSDDFPFKIRIALWCFDDREFGDPTWGWDMSTSVLGVTTEVSRSGLEDVATAREEADAFVPALMENALCAARVLHGDRFDALMDDEWLPRREDFE